MPEALISANKLRKFKLTPAEIKITRAIFQGKSVAAYAEEARISINTARWHVKQIYAKTDAHR
jgi:DNA-binding CsgD family transcriptional regulator